MITNLDLIIPELVKKLEESEFEFHLTGSRFFGNYCGSSDYDFFTQYSLEVYEYLVSLGFELLHETKYTDTSVLCVFRKNIRMKYENSYHGTHIDVQLVKSAEIKTIAQMAIFRSIDIFSEYMLCSYSSVRIKELWNREMEAAENKLAEKK